MRLQVEVATLTMGTVGTALTHEEALKVQAALSNMCQAQIFEDAQHTSRREAQQQVSKPKASGLAAGVRVQIASDGQHASVLVVKRGEDGAPDCIGVVTDEGVFIDGLDQNALQYDGGVQSMGAQPLRQQQGGASLLRRQMSAFDRDVDNNCYNTEVQLEPLSTAAAAIPSQAAAPQLYQVLPTMPLHTASEQRLTGST